MFWVSQMLSLTELFAGSSVSILTAFAITRVSLACEEASPRIAATAAPAATSARRPPSTTRRSVDLIPRALLCLNRSP